MDDTRQEVVLLSFFVGDKKSEKIEKIVVTFSEAPLDRNEI